jgi:hypothetical protein
MTIALRLDAVMNRPNPNGLIPTSLVPNRDMNGITNELPSPSNKLSARIGTMPGVRHSVRITSALSFVILPAAIGAALWQKLSFRRGPREADLIRPGTCD